MRPEAIKAAEWWTEQVRKKSNAPDPMVATIASVLGGEAFSTSLSEHTLSSFKVALAMAVDDVLGWEEAKWVHGQEYGQGYCFVAMDYDPNFVLADALEQSGIGGAKLYLPLKTSTRIEPGNVTAYSDQGTELVYGGEEFDSTLAAVRLLIELVEDLEARSAVNSYLQTMLEYVEALKGKPEMTQEELEELKKPSHAALDRLSEHSEKTGVDNAIRAITAYEMTLH